MVKNQTDFMEETPMKRFPLILTAIMLFSIFASAQPPDTLWTQTFGGGDWDAGECVQQCDDGGYIIVGSTYSYGAGESDVFLLKTDNDGNEEWRRTFGGDDSDAGLNSQQTTDGGYIIAGSTESYGAGYYDVLLIKTDENGNRLWWQTFGGSGFDIAYSVQQTSDGGYIIVGWTSSFGAEMEVYIIKTDDSGNEEWSGTYIGIYSATMGKSVQQTFDGGYIILGSACDPCNFDTYLLKIDALGDEEWSRIFETGYNSSGTSVLQTSNGGYIFTGWEECFGFHDDDVFLIKTDSDGNLEWRHFFGWGEDDRGLCVKQTYDGGYIITGYIGSNWSYFYDVYLIKTDVDGYAEWTQTFGGDYPDRGEYVQQTDDGGYIIAGYTYSYGAGDYDVWLIKTEPDPFSYVKQISVSPPISFTLHPAYPNPFNSETTITFDLPFRATVKLAAFDITGRRVADIAAGEYEPGSYQLPFNGENLTSGLYIVRLEANGFTQARKLLLIK